MRTSLEVYNTVQCWLLVTQKYFQCIIIRVISQKSNACTNPYFRRNAGSHIGRAPKRLASLNAQQDSKQRIRTACSYSL
jgi:hypothetical protein